MDKKEFLNMYKKRIADDEKRGEKIDFSKLLKKELNVYIKDLKNSR